MEALCEDDVSPIFQDIASIDETGITTADGTHEAFDAIICATVSLKCDCLPMLARSLMLSFHTTSGFRCQLLSPFPICWPKRRSIRCRVCPKSYLLSRFGDTGFPSKLFVLESTHAALQLKTYHVQQNYFTFNGPNAPVGAGSLVPATEAQGDYMVKVGFRYTLSLPKPFQRLIAHTAQAILKLQKQGIKTMEVQQQAVNDFVEHTDKYMPRTVWSTGCRVRLSSTRLM